MIATYAAFLSETSEKVIFGFITYKEVCKIEINVIFSFIKTY